MGLSASKLATQAEINSIEMRDLTPTQGNSNKGAQAVARSRSARTTVSTMVNKPCPSQLAPVPVPSSWSFTNFFASFMRPVIATSAQSSATTRSVDWHAPQLNPRQIGEIRSGKGSLAMAAAVEAFAHGDAGHKDLIVQAGLDSDENIDAAAARDSSPRELGAARRDRGVTLPAIKVNSAADRLLDSLMPASQSSQSSHSPLSANKALASKSARFIAFITKMGAYIGLGVGNLRASVITMISKFMAWIKFTPTVATEPLPIPTSSLIKKSVINGATLGCKVGIFLARPLAKIEARASSSGPDARQCLQAGISLGTAATYKIAERY